MVDIVEGEGIEELVKGAWLMLCRKNKILRSISRGEHEVEGLVQILGIHGCRIGGRTE